MLQVWMRGQHSPLAVWQTDSKQWQTIAGWQQLQELTAGYRHNNQRILCLYFPSTHLLQIETDLSSAQLKQLGDTGKQYLFEESSIAPIEQLVVKQNLNVSHYQLHALAQNDIDLWQQSAQLAGFSISALLPDFLLLPVPEEGAGQQVIMYQDNYTTLLRQSPQQGMAVNYLPSAFERLPHLSEVCLLPSIDQVEQTLSPSTAVTDDINNDLEGVTVAKTLDTYQIADERAPTPISTLLADNQIVLTELSVIPIPIETPERHALNFFTKTSDNKLSPYLRVAASVALCALVLQMVTDGVQLYRYDAASVATQSAVEAQFQSWFPEDRLNPNNQLQTQMDPKLANRSEASASHIAALSRISPLIKQSPLKAQALMMQPTALNFTIIAPNRESLDEFTSTLVSQGLAATLERVNGSDNGEFSGQITVTIADDSVVDSSNTATVS